MFLFINYIYAALTGWSLGYCSVYYTKYEYHKYCYVLFYTYFIYTGFVAGLNIIPSLVGLACCIIVVVTVKIPKFSNGYKMIQQNNFMKQVKKVKRT